MNKCSGEKIKKEAHAKINLSLDVVGKRENGYHLVKMIMQDLELHDDVFLENSSEEDSISLEIEDLRECSMKSGVSDIPADDRNLMIRAAKLLFNEYDIHTGLKMKLIKRIPAAAGLAGGSADAAAVLSGINELLKLGLSQEQLEGIGVKLGADIPYCLRGGLVLSEGIGEKMTDISGLSPQLVLLAKPDAAGSTPVIYKKYDEMEQKKNSFINHPDTDKMLCCIDKAEKDCSEQEKHAYDLYQYAANVLEVPVSVMIPAIKEIETIMNENGAVYSAMTGSGSTVFGIFKDENLMHEAALALKNAGLSEDLSDVIETVFRLPHRSLS